MAFLSAVVVLVVVVCSVHAGDYCKTPRPDQEVDIKRLGGVWWEKESFNTDSFVEPNDKCHVSRFYPSTDKTKIDVSNEYVRPDGNKKKYSYTIVDKDIATNDGNLEATMNILEPALGPQNVEWDILETDYENYLLVKICHDGPETRNDFLAGLLLVRDKDYKAINSDDKVYNTIRTALHENHLHRSFFHKNRNVDSCADANFPDVFTASA